MEIITLYSKEKPEKPVRCIRKEYYDNKLTKYKKYHPALIDVFLFNKYGDVLLQKRARDKRVNPNKLHTTVGGHINWGERPEFSLVHECIEELGAPVLLFPKDEYNVALEKLGAYTHKLGLVYEVKNFFRNYLEDERAKKDTDGIIGRIWLYFGRYDGPVDIPDRTSSGYEWINFDILLKEIKNNEEQFTPGLALYVEEFQKEMQDFVKKYSPKAV